MSGGPNSHPSSTHRLFWSRWHRPRYTLRMVISLLAAALVSGAAAPNERLATGGFSFIPPANWTVKSIGQWTDLWITKNSDVRLDVVKSGNTVQNVLNQYWDPQGGRFTTQNPPQTLTLGPYEVTKRTGTFRIGVKDGAIMVCAWKFGANHMYAQLATFDLPSFEAECNDIQNLIASIANPDGTLPGPLTAPPTTPPTAPPAGPRPPTTPGSSGTKPADPVPGARGSALRDPRESGTYIENREGVPLRLTRLSALLRERPSNSADLIREAVLLCGFSIRDENKRLLQPPQGPPIHLSVTDQELRLISKMQQEGHAVSLENLAQSIDPLLSTLGKTQGLRHILLSRLDSGRSSHDPALRNTFEFLCDNMVDSKGDLVARAEATPDIVLSPIQALLILRLLSEDIKADFRRGQQKANLLASIHAAPYGASDVLTLPTDQYEDLYVGNVLLLYGSLFSQQLETLATESAEAYGETVGTIQLISSLPKFILTFRFLKIEATVLPPGNPLTRTTSTRDVGEIRTIRARVFNDGTAATDWVKENRKALVGLGFDFDLPHSGPLKGVETEWDITQSRMYATKQLVETVRGTPTIDRILTNADGIAEVTFQGKAQPVSLPRVLAPVLKEVPINISAQTKSNEASQAYVDSLMGSIGLISASGGAGVVKSLVPTLMECLYRMKWHAGGRVVLEVKDWVPSGWRGTLRARVQGKFNGSASQGAMWETFSATIDDALDMVDVELSAEESGDVITFVTTGGGIGQMSVFGKSEGKPHDTCAVEPAVWWCTKGNGQGQTGPYDYSSNFGFRLSIDKKSLIAKLHYWGKGSATTTSSEESGSSPALPVTFQTPGPSATPTVKYIQSSSAVLGSNIPTYSFIVEVPVERGTAGMAVHAVLTVSVVIQQVKKE